MVGTSTVPGLRRRGRSEITAPVFNVAPAPGEPAAFAFCTGFFAARLDTSVLSDGNYAVHIGASDLPEGGAVIASFAHDLGCSQPITTAPGPTRPPLATVNSNSYTTKESRRRIASVVLGSKHTKKTVWSSGCRIRRVCRC